VAKRDVVVVGASAGGVEALREVVAGLPVDFPAAVLVVLHVPPAGRSALPQILTRAGKLPARHASGGEPLKPGTIVVAPPDRHLIVYDHATTVTRGPKENGHRPAVDVLFRTAARSLGPRVVSVILSGALDDGAAGMAAVKSRGGIGIAQDPGDALNGSMPRSAIAAGGTDHVLPVAQIPSQLITTIGAAVVETGHRESGLIEVEAAMAELEEAALIDPDRPGQPAGLTCPDCHGSLFEIGEGQLIRFRCRVGHAWSPASLVAQQSSSHESALWMALRSLQEKAALSRNLGQRAADRGHRLTGDVFFRQADDALKAAGLVRDLIEGISGTAAMLDLPEETATE
jgi:two-component system, chemotaxis family, protein-glutamate methylesterase/glutaminase